MTNLRVLAFSDIEKWRGYERLVDTVRPDLIVLAGDLTSDGGVSFSKYSDIKRGRRVHVDRFYKFLTYAGARSQVLIVKGNHDDDFEGDYIPEKIDEISGCKEISGKVINVNGMRFLGLGFSETHYLKTLKPLIEKFEGKVDVVIAHCERERVPLLSLFKPKLIIRGHFDSGKCLVNGIPAVFIGDVFYTVIEFEDKSISRIMQYGMDLDGKIGVLGNSSCSLWFEMHEWCKPYHM